LRFCAARRRSSDPGLNQAKEVVPGKRGPSHQRGSKNISIDQRG